MKRVWKPVVGYEDNYRVSDDGRVKSAINGRILKQQDSHGYKTVVLSKNGKSRTTGVHRLVCEAFNGSPASDDMQVDHLNMNRSDNRPINLEWVTPQENQRRRAMMRKCVRGVSDDGAMVIFPTLISADLHGFNSAYINKAISMGVKYQGFMWEVIQ